MIATTRIDSATRRNSGFSHISRIPSSIKTKQIETDSVWLDSEWVSKPVPESDSAVEVSKTGWGIEFELKRALLCRLFIKVEIQCETRRIEFFVTIQSLKAKVYKWTNLRLLAGLVPARGLSGLLWFSSESLVEAARKNKSSSEEFSVNRWSGKTGWAELDLWFIFIKNLHQ